MINTCIVIAAYNEEDVISRVLSDVGKYADLIIVVDDGSTDSTALKIKDKKIVLLRHIVNLGQGAALQTGFEYAKSLGVKVCVTYDADGQFKASDIPKMVKPVLNGKVDVTLGSRFLGTTKNIPTSRLLTLKLGLVFTRIYTGLNLTDTYNGLRAFSTKALESINVTHNRWAHPADILFQIAKYNLTVSEVPVTVYYSDYSWEKRKRSVGLNNTEALKIPFKLLRKALFN